MRKFNVNVNGNNYVVEVEELTDGAAPVAVPAYTAPAPAPAPAAPRKAAPAPAPAPAAAPSAAVSGGTPLKCPIPGKILKLLVANGAKVAKNQKVLILEAMKMENDIVAPADGVITFVAKEGDDVVSQQDLAIIK